MALFDKDGRLVLLGVAIGAGGLAVLPYVGPVVAAVARPLTKAVLTEGWIALERTRERAAEVAEKLEDILAEVRAKAEETQAARKAAARDAAGDVVRSGEPGGGEIAPNRVN